MKYSRRDDVLFRAVPGYLALSSVDGSVAEVHGPGADVWQEIAVPTQLDQIVDRLAQRFAAERRTVLDDVQRLLAELEDGGYVAHDG